ncbi:MAG: hypothetical protein IH843_03535, partial [Thaumarchaeota archaeon]|nr:hypothetical protein [Nitrososphaerota archaeon]
ITLFIEAQKEYGENRWVAEDLIKGRCKLVVQNLNIPGLRHIGDHVFPEDKDK